MEMKKIWLLLLCLPFVFASCVDEDETLGLDLIDQNDRLNVGTYDGVTMRGVYFKEDSLVTANYRYNVLGEYRDSRFGKVSSSIYTQMTLSMPSANFHEYDIDSVVLSLAYAGGFAEDTTTNGKEMRLKVYELSEDMDSTKQYSFDDVSVNPSPIYSQNITIDYNKDVIIGADTLAPHLRASLTGDFLNKIKNFSGENAAFITQFKGLKFSLEKIDDKGMMAYIDMTSSLSCITIYYTVSGKTQQYIIKFPSAGHRFMHYDYDFSGSDLQRLSSNDTLSGEDLIYLGSMGISMAKISIEDFREDWKNVVNDSNANNDASINSALLEFPIADISLANNMNSTSRILCYRKSVIGSDTNLVLIHDAQASDLFYNGYYDTKSQSYKMYISMHLANYLNGNITDPDIYLIPDARRSSATRVILNGPRHATKPATIKVTYTKNN